MGEVYRAQDTRLGRTVAVKVLSRFGHQGEDGRQRFEREARVIASLSHPNICTIYDVGQQDGIDYLVMECLEGETLQTRLTRGPLAFDDGLRYAIQIAEALDRAHRSGIVHRDLKPGNVMLTKDGAKLLDFGLAKLQSSNASTDETAVESLTGERMMVGTLPYMAPEQLEGRPADTRSDIFAFGCVLFEMLTGRRAFAGSTQASLIAAIIGTDPAFENTGLVFSPEIVHLIRTCLAKNPEERWQSARDLVLGMKFLSTLPAGNAHQPKPARSRTWTYLAAAVLAGAIAGLIPWSFRRGERAAPLVQLQLTAPTGSEFSGFGSAISPDGRYIAFVAMTSGKERLWLRALDAQNARLLEDTEGAQFPFWSPDSRSIGFFSRDKLKRFDLDGVGSRTIATARNGRGGTWNRDGVIVYSPNLSSRLWRVPASGGDPTPATILDASRGDIRHNFPQFLPDGRHFLFLSHSTDPRKSGPRIGLLDDPAKNQDVPELAGNAFQAIYAQSPNASSGHLIFVRERTLVAQNFNLRTYRLEGEPHGIFSRDSFNVASSPGFLNLTASSTGTLLDGGAQRARNELVWRKRDGTLLEVVGEENDYITPRISPDGSRAAVTRADSLTGDYDIWLLSLRQKVLSRFTFTPGLDFYPVWTPDASSIVYSSEAAGRLTLFRKSVGGLSESSQLIKNTGPNPYAYDISEDGKFLSFVQIGEADGGDIWILSLDKNAVTFPYLKTTAGELHPHFSRGPQSGKWIVYTSDESGVEQVYVRRFSARPAGEAKWQISSNGGKFPLWRKDGSEIIYLGPDGKLMAVPVRFTAEGIDPGFPIPLFDPRLPSTPFSRYPYDVSSDGQKFLVLNAPSERSAATLSVLLNWTGLLKR
jgi:Tol biopolymer transport system component